MINIFIIYAREDTEYKDRLLTELIPFENRKEVKVWHDALILAGDKWQQSISDNIFRADLVIALISAHFLASNYIQTQEFEKAYQRYKNKELAIIPVVVRSCNWNEPRLEELQVLPKDAQGVKPVNKWQPVDDAYFNINLEIRKKVDDLLKQRSEQEKARLARDQRILQENAWGRAKNQGTIPAIREYVEQFGPSLTHEDEEDVFAALKQFREEIDFTIACLENTPDSYQKYLRDYNKSTPKFERETRQKLPQAQGNVPIPPIPPVKILEKSLDPVKDRRIQNYKPWILTGSVVVLLLLFYFYQNYKKSIEEKYWKEKVEVLDTKGAYQTYLKDYPLGRYAKIANDSIRSIDYINEQYMKSANGIWVTRKITPLNKGDLQIISNYIAKVLARDPENLKALNLKKELE